MCHKRSLGCSVDNGLYGRKSGTIRRLFAYYRQEMMLGLMLSVEVEKKGVDEGYVLQGELIGILDGGDEGKI